MESLKSFSLLVVTQTYKNHTQDFHPMIENKFQRSRTPKEIKIIVKVLNIT